MKDIHKMKKLGENLQMLLIYVAIGIISACITGYFLYQYKAGLWKAQACSTLRTALKQELQKRDSKDIYFATSGNTSLPSDSIDIKKEPIKVTIESEYGKKDFFIPYDKHIHNIERPSDIRALHSCILAMAPLKADSLNMVWENLLVPIGFPGRTNVRISVVDWWEHETYAYSGDSLYVTKSDSLITYYLGYCCEIGVTGYMHYPWWKAFTTKDKILLCIIVLCCFLLFFIQEHIVRVYRRFFVKEVPVIVEKEIPVIAVEKSQAHIYQLEDDLYFDADSGKLSRTDACVMLSSLPAKLLQGFLEAENYLLSNNEIMELLWQDGTGTSERVHTAITRLRKELSKISNWEIANGNSSYRLKMPHSIEEIQS